MFETITFHSNPYFGNSTLQLASSVMPPDVYILLSSQGKEVYSPSWGDRYTQLAAHWSERLKFFSAFRLICLGNIDIKKVNNNTTG